MLTLHLLNLNLLFHPHHLLANYALLLDSQNRLDDYLKVKKRILQLSPSTLSHWIEMNDILLRENKFHESLSLLNQAIEIFPHNTSILNAIGVTHLHLDHFDLAYKFLSQSLHLDPLNWGTLCNIGTYFHKTGDLIEAVKYYRMAVNVTKHDEGFLLNNLGAALMSLRKDEEALKTLKKSLFLDPNNPHALSNLGTFYQEEGLLEEACLFFQRTFEIQNLIQPSSKTSFLIINHHHDIIPPPSSHLIFNHGYSFHHPHSSSSSSLASLQRFNFSNYPPNSTHSGLLIRQAILQPPIMTSVRDMMESRFQLFNKIHLLSPTLPIDNETKDPGGYMERIHFYSVYHGVNDRRMQEEIAFLYYSTFTTLQQIHTMISPSIPPIHSTNDKREDGTNNNNNKKVRIGFFSKFFGLFEPHGMLLEGVMKHLPRSIFHVIALPVTIWDKPFSPDILNGSDEVHIIPMSLPLAIPLISKLKLDILIYADVNSEPLSHFLSFIRLAPIQIAFWGNPMTTGNPSIDYFISSDLMEYPFRTQLPPNQIPYSEQVVHLGGQGIWYSPPHLTI